MKGRRIGFAIQVPMEKGRRQVSIGVVDHVSQSQGFVTYKEKIVPDSNQKLRITLTPGPVSSAGTGAPYHRFD